MLASVSPPPHCRSAPKVLNLAESGLSELAPLGVLRVLEKATLQANAVSDMEEVEMMLHGCRRLTTLDLRDNPVERVPKFREQLIIWGALLSALDTRPITSNERAFLQRLQLQKQQRLIRRGINGGESASGSPEASASRQVGMAGGAGSPPGGAPSHGHHPSLPSVKGGFGAPGRHGGRVIPHAFDHVLPVSVGVEFDPSEEEPPSPDPPPIAEGMAALSIAGTVKVTGSGRGPLPGGGGMAAGVRKARAL